MKGRKIYIDSYICFGKCKFSVANLLEIVNSLTESVDKNVDILGYSFDWGLTFDWGEKLNKVSF